MWVVCSIAPGIPFGPNYKSELGQISEGFFSRMEAPRAQSKGVIVFPDGLKYTIDSIGTIKHTWGYLIMEKALSAYIRGTTFLPEATINWYQAWDDAGKGPSAVHDVSERIY